MGLADRIEKPKTRKGAQILKAREPQLVEGLKRTSFVKGANVNRETTQILKDIYKLKKEESVFFEKKLNMLPFEDSSSLEQFLTKNDTSLFAFGSHNKKRPKNIVLGRTFDSTILDMFEFGVENYQSLDEFKEPKVGVMMKPILVFSGGSWSEGVEMPRLKNFFIDFFKGESRDYIGLAGLEHVISFTSVDSQTIFFRSYKACLKKSGHKTPRVEIVEIGPRLDMKLRRQKIASKDHFKQALRKPKELKKKKKKNIEVDDFGSSLGRVHMERQNFNMLQTRKMKGLKNRKDKNDSTEIAIHDPPLVQRSD